MATIVSTELEVYVGASGAGAKVGNTISKQGSPANVNLNSTELGVALNPGKQYSVKARCTNSDNVTSDWTAFYNFKTLIFAELITVTGGSGKIIPEGLLTYTQGDISVDSCGVYISTNASGANAVRCTARSEEQFVEGFEITNKLLENTTYYVIPFVVDDLNREYRGDWRTDAESVNTGYLAPTVTISNVVGTTDTISGNVTIATNDTLASAYIDLWPTGSQTHYHINLSNATGLQTFSISNGDTDSQGNTIAIQPSTEYRLTVYATNANGGGATGSAQATVTTPQAVQSTIAITSITGITPTEAIANLSYGDGRIVQQPAQ